MIRLASLTVAARASPDSKAFVAEYEKAHKAPPTLKVSLPRVKAQEKVWGWWQK